MKNYKLVIQYDGQRYDGWQKQGNTEHTIQGKLEAVLGKMTGTTAEVHGAGRTDAGVHALGQVANVHLDTALDPAEIKRYLNHYLPEDIAVTAVEEASERFHSRLCAKGKTYLYRIEMGPKKDVFERKYAYGVGETLDVERMRRAAAGMIGQHDFKSFCSLKKGKKSTVRTMERITIEQNGTKLDVRFTGNGFLYNMVRIMMGTLIEAGQGKREPEEIAAVLQALDRQAAGFTAPSEGLFLETIQY